MLRHAPGGKDGDGVQVEVGGQLECERQAVREYGGDVAAERHGPCACYSDDSGLNASPLPSLQ